MTIVRGYSKPSILKHRAMQNKYTPNKILIFIPEGTASTRIKQIVPFTREQSPINGKATSFVCINHRCKLPTTDIDKMLSLFDSS